MKMMDVEEYVTALKGSPRFGHQVISHRIYPSRKPEFSSPAQNYSKDLLLLCQEMGIERFYCHQTNAFFQIEQGKHVFTATPTSSGKSLIYNIPVLNRIIDEPHSHALYIFPLKALAQDQLKKLKHFNLLSSLKEQGKKSDIAAIYDGDTTPYSRRKIRNNPPPVLITNPEMLHLSLLPFHYNWATFFENLKYIIIDEAHSYRGVWGSHFSWVIRRLKRITRYYGANPQFILCSATIGNPGEFGAKMIDDAVHVIAKSYGAENKKNFLVINPDDSAPYCASLLLEAAMKRGLRTIVYTQSRKMTELISLWTGERLGRLKEKLSSYRAGFLPEDRRKIEKKLSNGELLGVISTSALELGIDIGDLDICVLVGYPGSIMSTMQRGGRVGRGGRESLVVLIASEDALDQYFIRNPDRLFTGDVENAVINPFNKKVLETQLECAAAELPLQNIELEGQSPLISEIRDRLVAEALLQQSSDGLEYYASRKRPQNKVDLRGGGSSITLINSDSGEILGTIDGLRCLKETHPGAVYLHGMKTWYVEKMDLHEKEVVLARKKLGYYTRAVTSKNTQIVRKEREKPLYGCKISYGEVCVTEKVHGYQKRNYGTNSLIQTIKLDLPEQKMETQAIWIEIPQTIIREIEKEKLHFMGGLHALEHLLISVFPILILCDRNDIGGISCPQHEQVEGAAIFIYDGNPGGSGLSDQAYTLMIRMCETALSILQSCTCENGCPACIHSPKCGSGNRPIDKYACQTLLTRIMESEQLLHGNSIRGRSISGTADKKRQTVADRPENVLPANWGVFDLETKYSAQDVGGWHRVEKMGLSVGVLYLGGLDEYRCYFEEDAAKLIADIAALDLIVGFNNKGFDNKVLLPYGGRKIENIATVDLLEEIKNHLGYRLSLNGVAQHTLHVKKSGDGLQALQWFREKKFDLIEKYCRKDVEITKNLFLFGLKSGYFIFENKAGKKVRLPLQLDKTLARVLSTRTKAL